MVNNDKPTKPAQYLDKKGRPCSKWMYDMIQKTDERTARREKKRDSIKNARVAIAKCWQIGVRNGEPMSIADEDEVVGPDGLSVFMKRFCELHVLQEDAEEALQMAYWDLGGNKLKGAKDKAAEFLKKSEVHEFLAKCRIDYERAVEQLEPFLPGRIVPDMLACCGKGKSEKYPFRTPAQMRNAINAYFEERTHEDSPAGIHDMCQYLGIGYYVLTRMRDGRDAWAEVVEWAYDLHKAWLERRMWIPDGTAYKAADNQLSRYGSPRDPLAAEKTKAETVAIKEGGLPASRPINIVMFGASEPQKKIVSASVVVAKPARDESEDAPNGTDR